MQAGSDSRARSKDGLEQHDPHVCFVALQLAATQAMSLVPWNNPRPLVKAGQDPGIHSRADQRFELNSPPILLKNVIAERPAVCVYLLMSHHLLSMQGLSGYADNLVSS